MYETLIYRKDVLVPTNIPTVRTGNGHVRTSGFSLVVPDKRYPGLPDVVTLTPIRFKDGAEAARAYWEIPADAGILGEMADLLLRAAACVAKRNRQETNRV